MVTEADGGQVERKVKEDARDDLDPWAHACVASRANYVHGHGYAMTPILDMINHDGGCVTRAGIVEDELFLSVDKVYKEGDEVFISYGDITNLETLCNYGFVVSLDEGEGGMDNGSSGGVDAKTTFNEEIIDVSVIRRPPVKVIVSDVDGSFDTDALATLRSYLISPQELEGIKSTTSYANPISDVSEEDVYCLIMSFIDEAMEDANKGVERARESGDGLVERYLWARAKTLEKGLVFVKAKFPSLDY